MWDVKINWGSVVNFVVEAVRTYQKASRGAAAPPRPGGRPDPAGTAYPGDFTGRPRIEYAPLGDDRPDPGEVVWTWVPFQEDHTRGKDRPVLLVARDGAWLLGLMLTSKDHDGTRRSASYVDVGAGPWDPKGRASEVRVDRLVRVDPGNVRRIGAVMPRPAFNKIKALLDETPSS